MATLRTSGNTQAEAVRKVYALGRQVGLTKAGRPRDPRTALGGTRTGSTGSNRTPDPVTTITTRFVTERQNDYVDPRVEHSGGFINRHRGGAIQRLHGGGGFRLAPDERAAVLQTGEFVMQRRAVNRIGVGALRALNEGRGGVALGSGDAPARSSSSAPEFKFTIRPDRRRFGRDIGYDWTTRGW